MHCWRPDVGQSVTKNRSFSEVTKNTGDFGGPPRIDFLAKLLFYAFVPIILYCLKVLFDAFSKVL